MERWIDEWVAHAGPWLLPLLGLASLVEYVFPPFPGDTITLLGAYLAVRGEVPAWAVFAVSTLGSVVGIVADYRFGVWVGRRLEHPQSARLRRLLPPERLHHLEAQYRRWGPWLMLANRFVPVSRALFFVFAGMSGLHLGLTVLLGTVSAMAWNGLLILVGAAVGANFERLKSLFDRFNRAAFVVVAALALVALGVWLWRRRHAERSPNR